MTGTLQIASTTVAFATIPSCERGTRGAVQRETVARIIEHQFGSNVSLSHHADGSPYLVYKYPCETPLPFISVSHSIDLAVVAYDYERRIGIDAETYRDKLHIVKRRYLSSTEIEYFDTPSLLLNAWTAKEAVFKAAGSTAITLADISLSASIKAAEAAEKAFSLHTFSIGADTLTLAWEKA